MLRVDLSLRGDSLSHHIGFALCSCKMMKIKSSIVRYLGISKFAFFTAVRLGETRIPVEKFQHRRRRSDEICDQILRYLTGIAERLARNCAKAIPQRFAHGGWEPGTGPLGILNA
jgi:hypothetical protein